MRNNTYLEFYIEGTRSRANRMLNPKLGILTIITNAVLDGQVSDATLVPMSVNFEKTFESDSFPPELLGEPKTKESLGRALMASYELKN